jgi:hypothetical protein
VAAGVMVANFLAPEVLNILEIILFLLNRLDFPNSIRAFLRILNELMQRFNISSLISSMQE